MDLISHYCPTQSNFVSSRQIELIGLANEQIDRVVDLSRVRLVCCTYIIMMQNKSCLINRMSEINIIFK